MKYTDYSIEAILGFNSKHEILIKTEIKEEINDDEIMKYYNREKYPNSDQLEDISLHLHIKTSTLKTWYRNQRQQERKTPTRNQKCPLPKSPSQDQGLPPLQSSTTPTHPRTTTPPHPRTTTPPHSRTTTSSHPRTTTPPDQRTITPRVTPTVQSPSSLYDGSYHPYFQLISEKIGISPSQIDGAAKTSPRISPSQHGLRSQQSSPILFQQRFQNHTFSGVSVSPLHLPFHQYYGSPYFQNPVSTPSSLDKVQPLDLSKSASRSSPENHGIKQSNSPEETNRMKTHSPSSTPQTPEHQTSTKTSQGHQATAKTSPEHQIRTQTSPGHQARTKTSPGHQARTKTSPEHQARTKTSPEHQARTQTSPGHQATTKTSPGSVNQATAKIRTKSNKPSKTRSTPSPKLSFLLSPPEKQSDYGSGLRQLVIEGRSFSP